MSPITSPGLELLLAEIIDSGPKLDLVVALAAAPRDRGLTTRELVVAVRVPAVDLVDDLAALTRCSLVSKHAGDDAGWTIDATWHALVATVATLDRATVLELMVRVAVDRSRHERRDTALVLRAPGGRISGVLTPLM